MGLWGAAQATGFALGGFLGTAASDLARWLIGSQVTAYVCVFAAEAALFIVAAALARRIALPAASSRTVTPHGVRAEFHPPASRGST
jgi:BCD family chlorophyll transporter-like MFS transporter